jgi:hypothetical protein
MLTQDNKQTVGGQTSAVSNIIVKDCQAVSAG